jgi:phenylalanyl-tRNA synthetase beta chain
MKVSYNWLKQYIHLEDSAEEVGSVLTDTGLEVEKIEKFESIKGGLEGIVIGKVLTCEEHPNADRLSKTTVDIGNGAVVPIICGAPNVAAGQTVVVAKTGSMLFPAEGDAFKIKKAKIRGEVSEGMICAEDEIGTGISHDGIIVLKEELDPGTPASDYFEIENDSIYEIGLTPNRGDATSHIGVARDLKAAYEKDINWPSIEEFQIDDTSSKIKVRVENSEACPRYSGLCISGIKIAESPQWLKNKLSSIGLTPINNVVDITNFVLHETGQPLHAFDADEITGQEVIVKTMPAGSLFTTLDEKKRELGADDLMICNTKEGMCIAGVFGGTKSGVKDTTVNIFLESAYFSPDYIRKTAQNHGLKTDASFRFERGTDPNMTVFALKRAAILIKEIAGGKISSEVFDIYPNEIEDFRIDVLYTNIDRLIGQELGKDRIHKILKGLDIKLENKNENGFVAVVPPYRVDVQREADIIEEILRIYGFNNVDLPKHLGSEYLAEYPENDPNPWQEKIASILSGKGWYEILTNSLTKPGYVDLVSELDPDNNVEIINKLSEDLGVMKQSLLFTGLEVVAFNINRRQTELKFFEFGKTYRKSKKGYSESNKLALFMTGQSRAEDWRHLSHPLTFYDISAAVKAVLQSMIQVEISSKSISDSTFDHAVEIAANNKVLGKLGKIKEGIGKKFEIKQEIFFADLDWDLLLKLTNHNIVYTEVPRYPAVKRDLSLVIEKSITFEKIEDIARRAEPRLLKSINLFDVYEGERIEAGKKAYAVSFILQDQEKTLTDKVIDKTMTRLMKAFENETGALIRQ